MLAVNLIICHLSNSILVFIFEKKKIEINLIKFKFEIITY